MIWYTYYSYNSQNNFVCILYDCISQLFKYLTVFWYGCCTDSKNFGMLNRCNYVISVTLFRNSSTFVTIVLPDWTVFKDRIKKMKRRSSLMQCSIFWMMWFIYLQMHHWFISSRAWENPQNMARSGRRCRVHLSFAYYQWNYSIRDNIWLNHLWGKPPWTWNCREALCKSMRHFLAQKGRQNFIK